MSCYLQMCVVVAQTPALDQKQHEAGQVGFLPEIHQRTKSCELTMPSQKKGEET